MNGKLTDPPLLPRIAQGDQDAVGECLSRYGNLVFSLARRMLRSATDVEDAVQDIFIQIWQCADRFDPAAASETTFVAMIARRRLIDRLRRSKPLETADLESQQIAQDDISPLSRLETKDESSRAAECFEKLPSQQQEVLKLSIYHDHSQSQIANLTGVPLGTVKSFSRRGLIQLRDCMKRKSLAMAGEES